MTDQPESDLDDRVGPFYDDAGLLAHFGLTGPTVDDLVRSREVLLVKSADDERLYPSFQFGAEGVSLPWLRNVIAGLDPELKDPWGDAVWLNAPADELRGLTPAQALRTDCAGDAVRLAEQAGVFRLG